MLKLALIGKNISHSQSRKMYDKLLDTPFEYDLLDYSSPEDIPSASHLLRTYDGINITAPYKTHFIQEIIDLSKIGIVNVLKRNSDGLVEGTNTDLKAVEFIIDRYLNSGVTDFRLLGSGSMAQVCISLFKKKSVPFSQFSRTQNNLDSIFFSPIKGDLSTLVINTCSREFILKDSSNSCGYRFWDMNYEMPEHQKLSEERNIEYLDGVEQLSIQAKYAISFWNHSKT